MVSFPHCKINLGLNIIRKRSDGFHELATCFYPIPWTDILEIIPSNTMGFSYSGRSIPGDVGTNLCLRAYELLREDFDISPVKIHLHKILPIGAGLGGGSSDAAFTLRMLNDIFALNLTTTQFQQYAAVLGSDCAFFMGDKPKLGTGRGEVLSAIDINLDGKFLLLIKPDVHISTAEAYLDIHPIQPTTDLKEILEHRSINEWQRIVKNDFEETIFKKYPILQSIKEKLYELGGLYASMSGSGSSIFGIFEKEIKFDFPSSTQFSCTLGTS